jgi:FkbM family methyltransferase
MTYFSAFIDLLKIRDIKKWKKRHYIPDEDTIFLDSRLIDYIVSGGIKFLPTKELPYAFTVWDSSDLRPSDIVIDIGAHIGGFALRAGRIAKRVLAVEPVLTQHLIDHIHFNNLEDVVLPLQAALGEQGNSITISYENRSNKVPCYSLTELKKYAGGCDFLKMNCEGGEYTIDPNELLGIRRLEIQFHKFGNYSRFHEFKEFLEKNYRVNYTIPPEPFIIIDAHCTAFPEI